MKFRFRSNSRSPSAPLSVRDLFANLHEISFSNDLPALTDIVAWSERQGIPMQIHMGGKSKPASTNTRPRP
ncbi:hypothetical protein E3E11_02860 [Oecophyllibacter saccharovorans]|uniref:Uncharacterized protein n=1 Tax=Oecophyllibacter saccharovorans TaxID=2558360 RepID=A0A506UKI0_9PROT|nr:hypothetical protein [Oecophyllibacter saccharovorans]QDH14979.1 hypothetical protein E3E11_02860 [Oecophyllibacter saccharovorans]TPW33820.1 hypothetical protein E3202_04270 [Oecophyllibacter saccharovorans]